MNMLERNISSIEISNEDEVIGMHGAEKNIAPNGVLFGSNLIFVFKF